MKGDYIMKVRELVHQAIGKVEITKGRKCLFVGRICEIPEEYLESKVNILFACGDALCITVR